MAEVQRQVDSGDDNDEALIREAIKDPLVRRHLVAMLRAFAKRLVGSRGGR